MTFISQESIRELLSKPRRVNGLEHVSSIARYGCVLFGAGGRGQLVLKGLRAAGIEPRAFADNQAAAQGTTVRGLRVHSPAEAAQLFPEAVFVVTIWSDRIGHPLSSVRAQLGLLGVQRVVAFTALYEYYPECFLPDFFLDRCEVLQGQETAIMGAAALWSDAASATEFMAQLALRRDLDFSRVAGGVDYPAYFPPDLFMVRPDESFVDCGAYDGDTFQIFRRVSGDRFARYIALEPDSNNFAKLTAEVGTDARASLHPVGATGREERVRFSADGTSESHAAGEGGQEILCRPLDALLQGEQPTYLKMDIEGAEAGALRGARETLSRHRPILAVSVYHKAKDLWELPLLMAGLISGYEFHLRAEKKAGWDLVCYAIPHERSLPPAA